MLPLLRVLPVGSLLLTALVLVLAATPPRRPMLPHALAPAWGPLIDAAEHPEWRQFYMQAAFKRADELGHLRELPDTPTRMPVVVAPEPPKTVPPEELVVAIAPAAPARDNRDEAPAISAEEGAPGQPSTPAAPAPPLATATVPDIPEPPLPLLSPPQQIAGLPGEPETAESDDITGALDSPVVTATIPVEIGETSSTELPVVLPPERPVRVPPVRPKASSRAKPQPAAVRQSRSKRPVRAAKRPAAPAVKKRAQPASAQANPFQSLFGEH